MPADIDLGSIATLVGEKTRMRMLAALVDGAARTATELSMVSNVTASTASSHLAKLTGAGLLDVVRQGRHRYYRMANPDVARALEGLMALAAVVTEASRPGPRDSELRYARRCYDHLAGDAGVRLLGHLRQREFVVGTDTEPYLSEAGEAWCVDLGLELGVLKRRRRSLCRACLDWSERRWHLAGALGAALLGLLIDRRLATQVKNSRVVRILPAGDRFITTLRGPR